MRKHQVPCQKCFSLVDCMGQYGTEAQCADALFKARWPSGCRCPACGGDRHSLVKTRDLYPCSAGHHPASLTAGPLFEQTKLPRTTWFLAIHWFTQAKTGLSARALRRQIGVSYNTAWSVKHKLMPAMQECDDGNRRGGLIPLDDGYWGGERHGGQRGRGAEHKTPCVAAVALKEDRHPIAMSRQVVTGCRSAEIARWAKQRLRPGRLVCSDGLACLAAVTQAACRPVCIVTGGGPHSVTREAFTWVNTRMGHVKNALHGSSHAMNPTHLPRYLAEFCDRCNRRFDLEAMMPKFLHAAARTPPMPYRLLKLAEAYG